jgi:thioesterase domain-containing protein
MTDTYRAFNVGGRLPPLVLFRIWEKERSRFEALAALVGPDLPIYEVAPPEISPELTTVEGLVAAERLALTGLPIDPPYRFVGWSFAGVLSLELARRLRQEGIAVDHVGMIDTGFPLCRSVMQLLGQHARQVRQLPRGDRLPYATTTARRIPREAVRRTREFRRRERAKAEGTNQRVNTEDPRRLQATDDAYFGYRPEPFDGPVTLYVTEKTIESRCRDASTGWAPWLPALEVVRLPGSHFTIWDPPLNGVLADAVLTTVRQAAHGAPAP